MKITKEIIDQQLQNLQQECQQLKNSSYTWNKVIELYKARKLIADSLASVNFTKEEQEKRHQQLLQITDLIWQLSDNLNKTLPPPPPPPPPQLMSSAAMPAVSVTQQGDKAKAKLSLYEILQQYYATANDESLSYEKGSASKSAILTIGKDCVEGTIRIKDNALIVKGESAFKHLFQLAVKSHEQGLPFCYRGNKDLQEQVFKACKQELAVALCKNSDPLYRAKLQEAYDKMLFVSPVDGKRLTTKEFEEQLQKGDVFQTPLAP